MTEYEILQKMISFSDGNIHDIDHLIKVYSYAKTIARLENVDEDTSFIISVAAITHDIACALCREKYGSARGDYQELEGKELVRDFLKDTGLSKSQVDRVSFLVGHHHSLDAIDGADYQILIEADYIVNACENNYDKETAADFEKKYFKTAAGIKILKDIFNY